MSQNFEADAKALYDLLKFIEHYKKTYSGTCSICHFEQTVGKTLSDHQYGLLMSRLLNLTESEAILNFDTMPDWGVKNNLQQGSRKVQLAKLSDLFCYLCEKSGVIEQ
jgi:hypothetical protein